MKTYYLILFLLLIGCKSSKKTNSAMENPTVEIEIAVTEKAVTFSVKNMYSEPINILNPKKLIIEQFEDNNWLNLKILICPCDAPCNAPEEKKLLTSNQSYSFLWNKKESWCGNRTPQGIRETIEKIATSGLYRIKVTFVRNDEPIEIYKEFEIK